MKNFRDVLNAGLAKLPDETCVMRRGTILTAQQGTRYQVGHTVPHNDFTSSSTPFSGNYQFRIESRHGKRIERLSQVRQQREVPFRAGTRFRVLARRTERSHTCLHMEEID